MSDAHVIDGISKGDELVLSKGPNPCFVQVLL